MPKKRTKKRQPLFRILFLLNLFAKTFKLATLKQKSFLTQTALRKN
ncbi:conserved hypothetical protein [endosymbiont of Bathymodiolus septemdierum str. Myojin knoll]|uniref:Uncharacterized protein n=1 Tax=endosymbiont of Bathymodiolus septemdierum str. Myojin knoll TaxID=1303921 RepID=A0A0P0UQZ8_9GAMM|nr:conserved hypothetical protein [endosymbiont of Bathymodiolus septemdierum str. Myojin knoll]